MVILPATEADLRPSSNSSPRGARHWPVRASTSGRTAIPRRRRSGATCCAGDGRIVRIDGAAAAYAAFVFDGEPAYDRIEEGSWAAEGPYVAVHRLVVGERFVRRGVAAALLREAAPRGARARHPARSASTRIPTTGSCVRCS